MAEPVRRMIRLKGFAASALAALLPVLAAAQSLPDPTRPPPAFIEPGATGESAAEGSEAPELQSILVSKHRRQAVIGGKVVTVGDSVGQAKVVRISEDSVLLRTGKQIETLKLFPDIEKRKVATHKNRARAAVTE
ncbi:MSHA biogenesis protein MshK [Noviherbaspirillum sp. ST9]|uniref:MSHA biogenesis protein MshK n=1 Tax=Noviherbaspirillum sp. ST9 TaxID=3401606 RepID=UPI003B587FBB